MGNGSSSRYTPITDEFYILHSGNLALFTFVINRVKGVFTDIAKYFTAFTTVSPFPVMPTHMHQQCVTRIQKSTPASEKIWLFTRISSLQAGNSKIEQTAF